MLPTAAAPMARRTTEGSVTTTSSGLQLLVGSWGSSTATGNSSWGPGGERIGLFDHPTLVAPEGAVNFGDLPHVPRAAPSSRRGGGPTPTGGSALDGLGHRDALGEVRRGGGRARG